jgi:polar amino acid transport system substrate-binding protein
VLLVVGYGALALVAHSVEVPSPPDSDSLHWGGDRTGGAPFIYEDQDGNLKGFEVELADYLAGELGLHAEFVQGQWDRLPARLNRGDIDVVLNGYEWTAERAQEWTSSIPYYIYRLVLLARRDDSTVRSWDDLCRASPGEPRKRVGVLSGSSAQRYVEDRFGDDVEVLAYSEGVTSAMRLVEQGQLDATVQDYVAGVYYLPKFPRLHRVGMPEAPGYYVLFTRKDDVALGQRLNEALRKAIRSGRLRALYERYGIWTAEQAELDQRADDWPPETPQRRTWTELLPDLGLLARAALTTVLLSCLAMPLAIVLGLTVAVGRLYGPRPLGWALTAYVEFLRGTPLLLQLFVIFFLLPEVSTEIRIPAFWAGVFGLAINYSAYEAENYRAGLLAVSKGQMEAALALGMSTWTALRRVIVPQAVRIVIPPVTNDFIALFKDTSVCSVIAVTELTGRYNELYNNHPTEVLQLGLMTALLYLLMSYPLSLVARRLEQRFPKVVA